MGTGITKIGKKVIHKLLDNSEGNRILIDVKHLSIMARKKYYEILAAIPQDNITTLNPL